MEVNSTNILLVIIFYHPKEDDWAYVAKMGEKYRGYIVDNSEEEHPNPQAGQLKYICNHQNLGIAEAQNIALREAFRQDDFTHVVFFDQDSRVEMDYPERIAKEYESVKHDFPNLAIIGPTVKNMATGEKYHSVIHTDHFATDYFIPRREVISSGSCIDRDSLESVGLNDSKLFIDYVDFEWCWRAESKGYLCGITNNVTISHQVGKDELHFPGGYRVILSAPFRYFYQYRNYIWLSQRKYVPLQWKLATGIKFVVRLLYFPIFVKEGRKRFSYMLQGIKAGLKK